MGKGGAPTTTQTVQNQNVAYTPTGLQGFQNIYNLASQVASTPYQPYTGQLVQGLTPTQTGAIGNISNIAAQPLSTAQIGQYMNPFQQNVINATMANIGETNAQQMQQTTGQLQQAAGGIGADRVAVGQSELARQQALASNQTLAGLQQQNYAQALAAAQQQQGFGLGAAQAQLGAGTLQQQTGQAGLTAAYQQYLQQLAFPYQQAQFLAGIGLPALGAMGGTQTQVGQANQTFTPPGVSWLQGAAGLGALGYGLYSGSQGGNTGNSGILTGPAAGGWTATDFANQPAFTGKRGGAVPGYAGGGDTSNEDLNFDTSYDPHQDTPQDSSAPPPDPESEALKGVLGPSSYVPTASSPQAHDAMPSFAPMQSMINPGGSAGSNFGSTLSGLAGLGATAAKIIPMLAALKEGGRVDGYDAGGVTPAMASGMPGLSGMSGLSGMPGGMAYPTPAMMGIPITQGALPMSAQQMTPQVNYGQVMPNMLPPYPVNANQASNSVYSNMQQVFQQQMLQNAMAAMRQQQMQSTPQVNISTREYARGGKAIRVPDDDEAINKANWDAERDQIDRGVYGTSRKIEPGESIDDPEGRGRDVRQLADGGTSGDDPGWATDPTNPVYSYFHPTTFEDRWGDTPYPRPNPNLINVEGIPLTGSSNTMLPSWAVNERYPSDMKPAKDITDFPDTRYPNINAINMRDFDPAEQALYNKPGEAAAGQRALLAQNLPTGDRAQLMSAVARQQAALSGQPVPRTTTDVPASQLPPTSQPTAYPVPGTDRAFPQADSGTMTPAQIMNPNNFRQEIAQRPTARGLMGNPDFWVRAGLNILAANPAQGPIGTVASGLSGTIGQYDKWSKDDMTSMQKGQELAEKLMTHADRFTRLTADEKARIDMENQRLKETADWHNRILPQRTSDQETRAAISLMKTDPTGRMTLDEALGRIRGAQGATMPNPGNAPPANPNIGDRFQFKQGWGTWDGSKWVPDSGQATQ